MTVSEWVGTLRFVDVGLGAWLLEERSGAIPLFGVILAELKDRRVRVAGRRVEILGYGAAGGAAVEVQRMEPAG